VLNADAIAESKAQRTLVLSCYLQTDGGFDAPRLVRFDELTVPRSKLPYYVDRIVAPRLLAIDELRRPWFDALGVWDRSGPLLGCEHRQATLIAAAFSIVAEAAGKKRNYASYHQNIQGMLNTLLHSGKLARYSDLLTRLIENTRCNDLLSGKVGEHLRRYRSENQANLESDEWLKLRRLLPEALDPMLREELIYLDALPDWAASAVGVT
jgi:hypothetical protein